MKTLPFKPDYAVSPGEVLAEHLEAMGMSKVQLAERCGRPVKTISEIIHGKAAVTPETALQLARVTKVPAAVWQNLETTYRLKRAEAAEQSRLVAHGSWARAFPLKELIQREWLEPGQHDADLVSKLLSFFGVGTMDGWNANFGAAAVAYRRSPSFVAAPESVSAWLRCGEIQANAIECGPFDEGAFRKALADIRALTTKDVSKVWKRVVQRCAAAGVAVVLEPEFPRTHLSGVARWLSPSKALIQLSLRHKANDHLWFTFFHEAGHILLHGKKQIFVDERDGGHPEQEQEANEFAGDFLVPPKEFARFLKAGDFGRNAILAFADAVGVGPGIVVGRLQHDRHIGYGVHNDLKQRLAFDEP